MPSSDRKHDAALPFEWYTARVDESLRQARYAKGRKRPPQKQSALVDRLRGLLKAAQEAGHDPEAVYRIGVDVFQKLGAQLQPSLDHQDVPPYREVAPLTDRQRADLETVARAGLRQFRPGDRTAWERWMREHLPAAYYPYFDEFYSIASSAPTGRSEPLDLSRPMKDLILSSEAGRVADPDERADEERGEPLLTTEKATVTKLSKVERGGAKIIRGAALGMVLALLLAFLAPVAYWLGVRVAAYLSCPASDEPCWETAGEIVLRRVRGE